MLAYTGVYWRMLTYAYLCLVLQHEDALCIAPCAMLLGGSRELHTGSRAAGGGLHAKHKTSDDLSSMMLSVTLLHTPPNCSSSSSNSSTNPREPHAAQEAASSSRESEDAAASSRRASAIGALQVEVVDAGIYGVAVQPALVACLDALQQLAQKLPPSSREFPPRGRLAAQQTSARAPTPSSELRVCVAMHDVCVLLNKSGLRAAAPEARAAACSSSSSSAADTASEFEGVCALTSIMLALSASSAGVSSMHTEGGLSSLLKAAGKGLPSTTSRAPPAAPPIPGPQFTCFASTKVRILTGSRVATLLPVDLHMPWPPPQVVGRVELATMGLFLRNLQDIRRSLSHTHPYALMCWCMLTNADVC